MARVSERERATRIIETTEPYLGLWVGARGRTDCFRVKEALIENFMASERLSVRIAKAHLMANNRGLTEQEQIDVLREVVAGLLDATKYLEWADTEAAKTKRQAAESVFRKKLLGLG
jgi:hypothetical protein